MSHAYARKGLAPRETDEVSLNGAGRGRQNENRSKEQKVHGVDEDEHCHD